MSEALLNTIGDPDWLKKNADGILEALPETWTHMHNLNGPALGFKLKLLGVDWRSEDEFGKCMVFLERVGILKRDGLLVRRGAMVWRK